MPKSAGARSGTHRTPPASSGKVWLWATKVLKDWRPNSLGETTGYYHEVDRVQRAKIVWEFC
eukprot:1077865-Lingulodinium_polyedra.AAC.1